MNLEQRLSELEARVSRLEKEAAAATTAREIWILTKVNGEYVSLGVANGYEAAASAHRQFPHLDIYFLVDGVVFKHPRTKELDEFKRSGATSNN
jgi:hypothetical protein